MVFVVTDRFVTAIRAPPISLGASPAFGFPALPFAIRAFLRFTIGGKAGWPASVLKAVKLNAMLGFPHQLRDDCNIFRMAQWEYFRGAIGWRGMLALVGR
jgi:hypothetical protein